jgi:hypothetical protein
LNQPKEVAAVPQPAREQRKIPLPDDLLEAVKEVAEHNERSMVGEIRFALWQHVRRERAGQGDNARVPPDFEEMAASFLSMMDDPKTSPEDQTRIARWLDRNGVER